MGLSFTVNPFTKDIVKKVNEDAIKQSVANLLRTKKYERPFHPEIASDLETLLFENYSPIMQAVLKKTVEVLLEKFEPRVKVVDVKIDASTIDSNEISITVDFRILNNQQVTTVKVLMTRAR